MGKRVIQECDLTKQEIPEGDEVVTITIKRDGKKSGRSYELSSAAAAKLEQQLVGGKETILPHDWSFANKVNTASPGSSKKTLGDLEAENDEKFVRDMKADVAQRQEIQTEESPELQNAIASEAGVTIAEGKCRHLNKGRVQTTLKDGKRFAYQTCTECRVKIPLKTTDERKAYMNGKLPPDINMRDLER